MSVEIALAISLVLLQYYRFFEFIYRNNFTITSGSDMIPEFGEEISSKSIAL